MRIRRVLGALSLVSLVCAGAVAACGGDDTNLPNGETSDGSASDTSTPDGGGACKGLTCGTTCVDPTSDPNNCGACGHTCGAGHGCLGGACSNDVSAVAAGAAHACALLHDGTVWCWGNNFEGELGVEPLSVGSCGDNQPCRATPAQVPGLSDVAAIAAGGFFTCGLRNDGSVWCWGADDSGELGRGGPDLDAACKVDSSAALTTFYCAPTPAPVQLPPGTEIVQLAAGTQFACALTKTHEVFCWGLTPGYTDFEPIRAQFDDGGLGSKSSDGGGTAPHLTNVVEIAAGDAHACAVRDDGTVWCWGSNTVHQLGQIAGKNLAARATLDGGPSGTPLTGVAHVAASNEATCAVGIDGGVWCWGSNDDGVVEEPSGGTFYPRRVSGLPAAASIVANRYAPWTDSKTLASGLRSAFSVVGPDGIVHAWGGADYGLLGPSLPDGAPPAPLNCPDGSVCARELPGVQARQVSLGGFYGMALEVDGGVRAWGANPVGALGHAPGTGGDQGGQGDAACHSNPTRIDGLP